MKKTNEKRAFFILICLLLTLLISTGLAYKFRSELHISQRLRDAKSLLFDSKEILVRFNVIASIDDQQLRIIFSVPCRSLNQKYDMMKILPVIKHELLMALDRPDVIKYVVKRDFKSLKKQSLQIINNYSDKKIKRLYVEYFSLN